MIDYTIKDSDVYKTRYGLTDNQLFGGYHIGPKDHYVVSQALLSELGEYDFPVPPTTTGAWGFMDWMKYIIKNGKLVENEHI